MLLRTKKKFLKNDERSAELYGEGHERQLCVGDWERTGRRSPESVGKYKSQSKNVQSTDLQRVSVNISVRARNAS